jgi:hypothetical protein
MPHGCAVCIGEYGLDSLPCLHGQISYSNLDSRVNSFSRRYRSLAHDGIEECGNVKESLPIFMSIMTEINVINGGDNRT